MQVCMAKCESPCIDARGMRIDSEKQTDTTRTENRDREREWARGRHTQARSDGEREIVFKESGRAGGAVPRGNDDNK